jgi:uncharacterized membrane protein
MTLLLLGLLIFLATHVLTMLRGPRAALVGRLGEMGFKGAYSLVALVGFVLIVQGYAAYRAGGYIPVWNPSWLAHLALLLNLPMFVLLVAAYAPVGWIKSRAKHPMLLAVKIWATAHLISNGDLGSVLLFGAFLAWAVAARISLKRRPGAVDPPRTGFGAGDVVSLVAGLALYVAFVLWLHPLLIGVRVWPGV